MNNRRNRAFTLIELVVVILILGVLAALIVPTVLGRADEAKAARAVTDINTLSGALKMFYLHCDRYPTTEEGLAALRSGPADATGWKGPYLDKDVPLDPWENEYSYVCPGANGERSFTLSSNGPDKTPSTDDDITDTRE